MKFLFLNKLKSKRRIFTILDVSHNAIAILILDRVVSFLRFDLNCTRDKVRMGSKIFFFFSETGLKAGKSAGESSKRIR